MTPPHWAKRLETSGYNVAMINGAWARPFPLPEVMGRIVQHGTLCGSRVYGGATEDSDYDFIVRYSDFPELDLRLLRSYAENTSMPTLGWKFAYRCDGRLVVINLIVCTDPIEYDRWMKAHQNMLSLLRNVLVQELCHDKRVRVAIFTLLRERAGLADHTPGEPWGFIPGEDCPF